MGWRNRSWYSKKTKAPRKKCDIAYFSTVWVPFIGGASTNQEWADRIGADGWATDAASAVKLAEKLTNIEGAR